MARLRIAALFALLLLAFSCKPRASSSSQPPAASAAQGASAPSRSPYPRGRWRLAPYEDLDRTVVWVAHILIRHNEPPPRMFSLLRPTGWAPDPPAPDRSKAAALALADKVADLAQAHPETFPALAAQYSEDVETKDLGGSLGGIRATQVPAEILDAVAALPAGGVSRPIVTWLGVHIVKRLPMPPEERVAGQHLVIRYAGTYGGPDDQPSTRTRDEALRLAQGLLDRLRAGADFDQLVRENSENEDMIQGGDIGLWSTREPSSWPREIERLATLRVGEVWGPLDSVVGFEVLRRTDAHERPSFAATTVQIAFDPGLDPAKADPDGNRRTKERAREITQSIADQVARHGNPLEAFERQYCCERPLYWTQGRGIPAIAKVVEGLPMGATAKAPIQVGLRFYVPKRIDPATVPLEPEPLLDLPAPSAPNFDSMVEHGAGASLAAYTREIAAAAIPTLLLNPDEKDRCNAEFDRLAKAFATAPGPNDGPLRLERLHASLSNLRTILGPQRYAKLEEVVDTWASRRMMHAPGG